jgi:hypothetical protein
MIRQIAEAGGSIRVRPQKLPEQVGQPGLTCFFTAAGHLQVTWFF